MSHQESQDMSVEVIPYLLAPVVDSLTEAEKQQEALGRRHVSAATLQIARAIDFIHSLGEAHNPLRTRLSDTSESLHYLKGFMGTWGRIHAADIAQTMAALRDALNTYADSGFGQLDEAYRPESMV